MTCNKHPDTHACPDCWREGPWAEEWRAEGDSVYGNAAGDRTFPVVVARSMAEEDARLAAAAPDMARALLAFVESNRNNRTELDHDDVQFYVEQFDAALRKAGVR